MIRRQMRAILLFLAAALVLGGLLAVLFATVWKDAGEEGEGELFMTDPLDMDEIAEIEVKNSDYAWRLYRAEDGELYFEGAEYVLYNQNMLAYLRSCTAYLSASGEVEEPEAMEEYSLTEETCLASFSVTSTAGERYRVLVGEKLVGGEGYYARLEDGDRVYVLSTGLERCLFGDLTFFLSGQVATALSESDYYEISEFLLERGGKPFVELEMIPEEEVTESDLSTHRIVYPAAYEPNTDLFARLFKSFVSFVGEEVVDYNLAQRPAESFAEAMRKFGFLAEDGVNMHSKLTYTYQGIKTQLYFSRVQEETVYVYSPGFDIIAAFSAESLSWVEYDLMEFTQAELFARSIEDVKSISLTSPSVSATFTLTHAEAAADLQVRSERGAVDVSSFRQFYTQLLYVKNEGYASVPDNYEELESLSLSVELVDGRVTNFVFYDVETRKSYYTVGGEGVFYINRDYVKKLIADAAKLVEQQPVEAVQYA